MKSIAIFNNKGGVGKTTLACNLAAYLALVKGLRILMVDCDPQCNATQLIMGHSFAEEFYWENAAHDGVTTIQDVLKPILEGDANIAADFAPLTNNRFGVHLLPGHPNLSMVEDKLSSGWSEVNAGEIGGYRKTTWVRSFCRNQSENYDFICFDLGPSLGSLNRSVLLGSEAFLTPMGADIFSILGIRNIAAWLSDAILSFEHGIPRCEERFPGRLAQYGIPPELPIKHGYLGYTLQQYISKSRQGVKIPTARYETIIKRVPAEVEGSLRPFFAPDLDVEKAKLGDVPHLYSLIPLAQTKVAPIFKLESKDGLVGSQFRQVDDYAGIVRQIADRVLANIQLKG